MSFTKPSSPDRLSKKLVVLVGAILVTTFLYALGITILFVPVAVIVLAYTLPFPQILQSLWARILTSIVLLMGLTQLAAIVQFFVLPRSGFRTLACLMAAQIVVLALVLPAKAPQARVRLINRTDVGALVTSLFFVLPFLALFGLGNVNKMAAFAGTQSVDASHHYLMTADMDRSQHFTFREGNDSYPKGFHIATAFIQNSMGLRTPAGSWSQSIRVYIGQYVVFGVMAAMFAFYLASQLMGVLGEKKRRWSSTLLLSVTLGASLSLFYLLPFLNHGFLNYYYICALIMLGVIFLNEYAATQVSRQTSEGNQWWLLAYCYVLLGVSTSWPLFIPPLVVLPLLYILPGTHSIKEYLGRVFARRNWVLIVGLLLQFVPLYFQVYYGRNNFSSEGLNAHGALRAFHFGVIIVSVLILLYGLWSDKLNQKFKIYLYSVFLPLLLFLAGLVALQYFTLGELRYYSIKSAYLIEILMLTTVSAWAVVSVRKVKEVPFVVMFIILPLCTGLLLMSLIGINENPLKEVRNSFRNYSKVGVPAYFDSDTKGIIDLNVRGKSQNYNTIVLHYDSQSNKLTANMQVPYWASTLNGRLDERNRQARLCHNKIYNTATFEDVNPEQQQRFIDAIKRCASEAEANNEAYYIITDDNSRAQIAQLFGNYPTIYEPSF